MRQGGSQRAKPKAFAFPRVYCSRAALPLAQSRRKTALKNGARFILGMTSAVGGRGAFLDLCALGLATG